MGSVKVVRPDDPTMTISGAGDEYAFLITGSETASRLGRSTVSNSSTRRSAV